MLDSSKKWGRAVLLPTAVALIAGMGGCGARPGDMGPLPASPVGADARAIQERQIEAAIADRLTFYRNEWAAGGDQLGEAGARHLEDIAALAGRTDRPILIEQDTDVQLNQARRDLLVRYLTEHRIDDAEHRVVVGRPSANGTPGDEAVEIFDSKPSPSASRGGASSGAGNRTSGGGF